MTKAGHQQDPETFWLPGSNYDDPLEIPNNIVEQDHRFIKKRIRPMLGFKSFHSASATLDGIEVAQLFRKKQFNSTASGFQQFAALAG